MIHLFHILLNLLFPPKCVLCGAVLRENETDLCQDCARNAPLYTNCKRKLQFLDSFTAVWYYEGNVRKSILHFKFHGKRQFAAVYGRLLAGVIRQAHPEGFDLLTWVPVSPLRKLSRGYDQADLLAQATGKVLGLPPVSVLKKVRHTPAQSGIRDYAQRRANVLGAYRCTSPETVRGKRILLLDDVLTTGATASEAAKTLKIMGAREVHCATLAVTGKE